MTTKKASKRFFSETIEFRGHENILGTHRNTLEVTKESEISKRADCIIGVSASAACADLNAKLIDHIRANGRLEFVIKVAEYSFQFSGIGSEELLLTDPREIVLRRSGFASPRTLAVHCDAAAIDVPRDMVRLLQNPKNKGSIEAVAIESSGLPDLETPSIEFV